MQIKYILATILCIGIVLSWEKGQSQDKRERDEDHRGFSLTTEDKVFSNDEILEILRDSSQSYTLTRRVLVYLSRSRVEMSEATPLLLNMLEQPIREDCNLHECLGQSLASEIIKALQIIGKPEDLIVSRLLELLPSFHDPLISQTRGSKSEFLNCFVTDCQENIFRLLGVLGESSAPAVSYILQRIEADSRHPGVNDRRHLFIETLGNIGPAARSAVPSLMNLMRYSKEGRSTMVVVLTALSKIEPNNEEL